MNNMNNPMNMIPMQPVNGFENIIQQAKNNPRGFEDYIRQTNPQAYQQAMQIRNSQNPKAIIMQMMQSKGINPNVLNMLGLI